MYYGILKFIIYFSLNCDKVLIIVVVVRDKFRVDYLGKRL